jgi:hypothetical protein
MLRIQIIYSYNTNRLMCKFLQAKESLIERE